MSSVAWAPATAEGEGEGGRKLVIAYGVADAEARAMVVSRAYLEELFRWSSPQPTASGGCPDATDGARPGDPSVDSHPTPTIGSEAAGVEGAAGGDRWPDRWLDSGEGVVGGRLRWRPRLRCLKAYVYDAELCTRTDRSIVAAYAILLVTRHCLRVTGLSLPLGRLRLPVSPFSGSLPARRCCSPCSSSRSSVLARGFAELCARGLPNVSRASRHAA